MTGVLPHHGSIASPCFLLKRPSLRLANRRSTLAPQTAAYRSPAPLYPLSVAQQGHGPAHNASAWKEREEQATWQQRAASLLGVVVMPVLCGCLLLGSIPALPAAAATAAAVAPAVEASAEAAETAQQFSDDGTLDPLPSSFPELRDIAPIKYEEVTLANGLRVVLVEDHEVPLVQGLLAMKGGMRASPPGKVGVATVAASVQRAGGSVAHPSNSLDDALEALGASVESSASLDSTTLSFDCLAEDVGPVLHLFAEVLRRPALPEARLQLVRNQALNVLEHQDDSPASIPPRLAAQFLYGTGSVFARSATPAEIKAITRDDVAAYLAAWQRPDAAVLGVAGDFDTAAMKSLLETELDAWLPAPGQPEHPLPLPNTPLPSTSLPGTPLRSTLLSVTNENRPASGEESSAAAKRVAYLVDRPGLTQASVAMGEVGIQLGDSDLYPLSVLNGLLNSFGGKLFDEIRSREGLAYGVTGTWSATPVDHPGLFMVQGETADPGRFVQAVQRVLTGVAQQQPQQREVASAQDQSLNSFVFNFSSTGQQLSRLVSYRLLGVPDDFLFSYRDGIKAVTPQQVLQAAENHLHPQRQVVVVAADAKSARPQLEGLGFQVVMVDTKGNPIGAAAAPAVPAAAAQTAAI